VTVQTAVEKSCFVLRERPTGRIDRDTFEVRGRPAPNIDAGEALVRVDWISLDPSNRAWLRPTPVVDGFDQLPTAINLLFDGGNVGKLVVKLVVKITH
jgi:NADPH-dependent curcumin reductase CurA